MEFFIPKFDENGHMNYCKDEYHVNPTYSELVNMLNDCVGLLKEMDVTDNMIETYGNILMNAENMLSLAQNQNKT